MKEISADIAAVAQSYKYHNPPELLTKLQVMLAQLLRLANDLLNSIHIKIPGLADSRSASTLMQILLYTAGLVATVLIIALAWSRLSSLRNQSSLARKRAVKTSKLLDAGAWKAEAEKYAQESDWRSACRALYLSLLQLLHEQGICEFAPARSNYEYWYALSRYPSLQSRFRQLVNPVELVWFGNQPAVADDYKLCQTVLTDLEGEINRLGAEKKQGENEPARQS